MKENQFDWSLENADEDIRNIIETSFCKIPEGGYSVLFNDDGDIIGAEFYYKIDINVEWEN